MQTKLNILLASLAVADLFVGAISMPLSITVDALVLCKIVNISFCESVCKSAGAVRCSLFVFVSFDYDCLGVVCGGETVRRCIIDNVIVTKKRVKKVCKKHLASSRVHDNSHPHSESSRCQL